jgi:hypothetical protein
MSHLEGGALIYANAQAESLFQCQLNDTGRRVQDFYSIRKHASRCRACCMARGGARS